MAERLRLTLKQIPWFLLGKSFLLALLFYTTERYPFLLWVFLGVALYFYFHPLFEPIRLLFPFILSLFFAFFLPPSSWLSLFLGVIFFLILGMKDLFFIDRKGAYETMVLFFFLLTFLAFFGYFENWQHPLVFVGAALPACVYFMLAGGLMGNMFNSRRPLREPYRARTHRGLVWGLGAFMVWSITVAALFLPLNFLYQTAISFLVATVLLELLFSHVTKEVTRGSLLVYFSFFLIFFVFILGGAEWGL